jgi:hypothetical protein
MISIHGPPSGRLIEGGHGSDKRRAGHVRVRLDVCGGPQRVGATVDVGYMVCCSFLSDPTPTPRARLIELFVL